MAIGAWLEDFDDLRVDVDKLFRADDAEMVTSFELTTVTEPRVDVDELFRVDDVEPVATFDLRVVAVALYAAQGS